MNSRENNDPKSNDNHTTDMENYLDEGSVCYKPLKQPKPDPKPSFDLNIADDDEELKYDARRKMYYRGEQINNNSYSFWFKAAATVGIVCTTGFALCKAIKR